jgi:hypothetical protein
MTVAIIEGVYTSCSSVVGGNQGGEERNMLAVLGKWSTRGSTRMAMAA